MRDVPEDAQPSPRGGATASRESRDPADPAKAGSRSVAAGWAFLQALAADLAQLAAGLWRRLATAPRRPIRAPAPRAAAVAAAAWTGAGGRLVGRLLLAGALAGLAGALAVACAMLWALHGISIDHPAARPQTPTLLITAANGAPLGRVGPFQVADVPLKGFAPVLVKAVLSVEDRRFYEHFGIDPLGILRAMRANRAAGQIVEGGSTITQQLVKLDYLSDDRTYSRKLREALLALWLESHLSKDEILTRYLNRVYLGDGAYGMAAAARLYFDKAPGEVTLPEAAMLAGLIQAPSQFDPLRHLAAARKRAAAVLDAMVANHAIDAPTAADAKAHPAAVRHAPAMSEAHSWFAQWVARRAADLAGEHPGMVRVRTTLRPDLQRLAQQALDRVLDAEGSRHHASEGALVAMRPDGAVVAMVGGRDYRRSQFNRAVDALRQPGSSFKLFVYLAALRQGLTPEDTIDGGPLDINGWKPQNFDNEQYGRITLADAFAHSVNTASARLAMTIGLDHVIAAARDLGITTPLPKVPSIALGSAAVNLLEMTAAYASVAADRQHVVPWGVAALGPADGSPLRTTRPVAPEQTLDPVEQPMLQLLQDVVRYGTGRRAALAGFAAGKTGTSQDSRDAWFIGFNDKLVTGVWIGNDDDAPMKRVVGGTLPAEIWREFMTAATPLVDRPEPPGDTAAGHDAGLEGTSQPPGAGRCDVQACAARYHSFRATDCTYQPYDGPRRLCPLGGQPADPVAEPPAGPPSSPAEAANTAAAGPGRCDVAACAAFYHSFDPATCTYQPFGGGPRQLCQRQSAGPAAAVDPPQAAGERAWYDWR